MIPGLENAEFEPVNPTSNPTMGELISRRFSRRGFLKGSLATTAIAATVSPLALLTAEMTARAMREIVEPTVARLAAEGTPFAGVLYAGLMITDKGPQLIEYNARFGDPECQVMMMRLKDDIVTLMLACVDGTLDRVGARWRDEVALTVVLAAKGYPGIYEKGSEIRGLAELGGDPALKVFHAGTRAEDGAVLANGGRVLNVTALGATVAEARARAYAAIERIDWPEGFCRRDIGWRAVAREETRG